MNGEEFAEGSASAPGCGCHCHPPTGLYAAAGWLAAALAALGVAAVPFDAGESLCGIWGCFPPLPALAALHLFTGVLAAAGVWAVRRYRPAALRPLGGLVLAAAVTAGTVFLVADVLHWAARVPDDEMHSWPNRIAYTVATATDVPLVQAVLAGAAGLVLAATRAKHPNTGK